MYPRWLWRSLALPGIAWLVVLFVVPFYAVLGVALGTVDPILFQPVPIWNPLEWNVGWIQEALTRLAPGGIWFDVGVRTIVYVLLSLVLCKNFDVADRPVWFCEKRACQVLEMRHAPNLLLFREQLLRGVELHREAPGFS